MSRSPALFMVALSLSTMLGAAALADDTFSCGKWRRLRPSDRAKATAQVVELSVANFAEQLEGRPDAKEHVVAYRTCLQARVPDLVDAIDDSCANRRSTSAADLGAALGPAISPCLAKWRRASDATPPG